MSLKVIDNVNFQQIASIYLQQMREVGWLKIFFRQMTLKPAQGPWR